MENELNEKIREIAREEIKEALIDFRNQIFAVIFFALSIVGIYTVIKFLLYNSI